MVDTEPAPEEHVVGKLPVGLQEHQQLVELGPARVGLQAPEAATQQVCNPPIQ